MSKIALVHGDLTERIVGVFYEVFRELGAGFLEVAYQRAMQVALADAGMTSAREVPTTVYFRDRVVGDYRMDLIVENAVIVECKTADRIMPAHRAQMINYLSATEHTVGLILNFGPTPTFARLIFQSRRKR